MKSRPPTISEFFEPALILLGPHAIDGHTNATFSNRALGAAERRVARVRINVLPCAIIARPEDIRILIEAERAYLIHDAADARVVLDDRIGDICSSRGTYD